MNTIRTFEVYLIDGKPHGYELTDKPYPASLNGYTYAHLLIGKRASFCVVSNDGLVDRTLALRFATAIAFGRVRTFTCDLAPLNGKR